MASPSAGAPALKYRDVNRVTPSAGEVKGLNKIIIFIPNFLQKSGGIHMGVVRLSQLLYYKIKLTLIQIIKVMKDKRKSNNLNKKNIY